MNYDNEQSKQQIKNVKRRIVSWIWECTPNQAIRVALFCGIKIPKQLLEKYASQDHGSS